MGPTNTVSSPRARICKVFARKEKAKMEVKGSVRRDALTARTVDFECQTAGRLDSAGGLRGSDAGSIDSRTLADRGTIHRARRTE